MASTKPSPPTTLDRLYRFSRHDYACHGLPHITWAVSAGSLEQTSRMYRYVYSDGEKHIEMEKEASIRFDKSLCKTRTERKELLDMYKDLRQFSQDVSLAPLFRLACLDLLTEDPWLVFVGLTNVPFCVAAK